MTQNILNVVIAIASTAMVVFISGGFMDERISSYQAMTLIWLAVIALSLQDINRRGS